MEFDEVFCATVQAHVCTIFNWIAAHPEAVLIFWAFQAHFVICAIIYIWTFNWRITGHVLQALLIAELAVLLYLEDKSAFLYRFIGERVRDYMLHEASYFC